MSETFFSPLLCADNTIANCSH